MEGQIGQIAVFFILAAVMLFCSIAAVKTKKILRAATYLLFVLFSSAGIYFQLNYSFLGAVQLTVYAGGVIVLYVFSILLTSSQENDEKKSHILRRSLALLACVTGCVAVIYMFIKQSYTKIYPIGEEVHMTDIGRAIVGSDKYGYILPFEILSILLLACVIGGILIGRKRN